MLDQVFHVLQHEARTWKVISPLTSARQHCNPAIEPAVPKSYPPFLQATRRNQTVTTMSLKSCKPQPSSATNGSPARLLKHEPLSQITFTPPELNSSGKGETPEPQDIFPGKSLDQIDPVQVVDSHGDMDDILRSIVRNREAAACAFAEESSVLPGGDHLASWQGSCLRAHAQRMEPQAEPDPKSPERDPCDTFLVDPKGTFPVQDDMARTWQDSSADGISGTSQSMQSRPPSENDTYTPEQVQSRRVPTTGRGRNNSLSTKGSISKPKPAMDKKELRAMRNRESARRSRMKSKVNFQKMEQAFIEMTNENKSLKKVVETLLPQCIDNSPKLKAQLEAMFYSSCQSGSA